MFPVWINDGSSEMPTDSIFYIVAKDGIYLKKSMGHFESVAKVDAISILEPVEATATLNVAKIKTRQFAQILSLFREVFKIYRAEANVILHYNPKRKIYRIDIPPQGVTGASVAYLNGEDTYPGYIRIGTIHSHANMSAFHSGTDHSDEVNWDGLHITLGKMGDEYFDISCSIMSGKERFMVNPCDYIDGIELIEYTPISTYKRYTYVGGVKAEVIEPSKLGYRTNAPEKDLCFPKKWIDKIAKYVPKPVPIPQTYGMGVGYTNPFGRSTNVGGVASTGQRSLFEGVYDISDDEWNPCGQCPYKNHKSDMLMKQLLDELDDDEAIKLGFQEDDGMTDNDGIVTDGNGCVLGYDETNDINSPFYVSDESPYAYKPENKRKK